MSGPAEIVERERQSARAAGIAAILVAPLFIGSLFLEGSTSALGQLLPTEYFRAAEEDSGQFLAAYAMRALALALTALPLFHLFRAAQARSERVSGPMVGFAFIGPVLYAASFIVANIAQAQVASDFVAAAGGGGDIYSLLEDLGRDSTLLTIGSSLAFPAQLGMVVAMVYICLQAQRAGLLTRFFGSLGMALGVLLVLMNPRFSLLVLAIWFGWLGFLFLDRLPRGRPPAWDAGVAIPWPRPGEEPAEPPDPETARANGFDAEPDPLAPSRDHSARRERARKRKRKRRR